MLLTYELEIEYDCGEKGLLTFGDLLLVRNPFTFEADQFLVRNVEPVVRGSGKITAFKAQRW